MGHEQKSAQTFDSYLGSKLRIFAHACAVSAMCLCYAVLLINLHLETRRLIMHLNMRMMTSNPGPK